MRFQQNGISSVKSYRYYVAYIRYYLQVFRAHFEKVRPFRLCLVVVRKMFNATLPSTDNRRADFPPTGDGASVSVFVGEILNENGFMLSFFDFGFLPEARRHPCLFDSFCSFFAPFSSFSVDSSFFFFLSPELSEPLLILPSISVFSSTIVEMLFTVDSAQFSGCSSFVPDSLRGGCFMNVTA